MFPVRWGMLMWHSTQQRWGLWQNIVVILGILWVPKTTPVCAEDKVPGVTLHSVMVTWFMMCFVGSMSVKLIRAGGFATTQQVSWSGPFESCFNSQQLSKVSDRSVSQPREGLLGIQPGMLPVKYGFHYVATAHFHFTYALPLNLVWKVGVHFF